MVLLVTGIALSVVRISLVDIMYLCSTISLLGSVIDVIRSDFEAPWLKRMHHHLDTLHKMGMMKL